MIYQVEVNKSGTFWRLNGKLHRENGPAVEYANGHKEWYRNDKLHREDGPAVDLAVHSHGHFHGIFHSPRIQNRQHARHARAYGTGVLVGPGPEFCGAGAENLAFGLQLGVHLQADDHFVLGHALSSRLSPGAWRRTAPD